MGGHLNRRDLLKAILPVAASPILVKGQEVGKSFKLESDSKYEVFINGNIVDVESFCRSVPHDQRGIPPGTPVHVVLPYGEQTMDDAIRIFKVNN